MLGIGFTEMVLIAGLALVVIGPEKFPDFAKLVIRTIRDLRGYVDEVKHEVSKEFKPIKEEMNALSRIDPEKYIDSLTQEAPAPKPANPGVHEEDQKVMDAAARYDEDPYGWEGGGSSPGGYGTEAGSGAPEATVGYGEAEGAPGDTSADASNDADTDATPQDGDSGDAPAAEGASGDTDFGVLDTQGDSEPDAWTGR